MLNKISMIPTLLILLITHVNQAHCFSGSSHTLKRNNNIPETRLTNISQADLKELSAELTEELRNLDQLIRTNRLTEARSTARALTSSLKERTGIEVNSPLIIRIPGIQIQKNEVLSGFDGFNPTTKTQTSRFLSDNLLHGYFLEIANLAKHVELKYIKAFYLQTNSMGQLRQRDVSLFKELLLRVQNTPLHLTFDNLADPAFMVVYDSEVYNEIYQYDFNRELLEFALSHKQLGFYSEENFETSLKEYSNNYRSKMRAGSDVTVLNTETPTEGTFESFTYTTGGGRNFYGHPEVVVQVSYSGHDRYASNRISEHAEHVSKQEIEQKKKEDLQSCKDHLAKASFAHVRSRYRCQVTTTAGLPVEGCCGARHQYVDNFIPYTHTVSIQRR